MSQKVEKVLKWGKGVSTENQKVHNSTEICPWFRWCMEDIGKIWYIWQVLPSHNIFVLQDVFLPILRPSVWIFPHYYYKYFFLILKIGPLLTPPTHLNGKFRYFFPFFFNPSLRGGVKIKKQENLGQCPNGGGQKHSNVPISILDGHYFSKMSKL